MPPPQTNLAAWFSADSGTFKDTAGTTPCTTAGDLIALWTGRKGFNVQQATSGNRPSYQPSVINGLPVARFTQSATTNLQSVGTPTIGIGTGGFHFACVWQCRGSGTNVNQTALSIGALQPRISLPLRPTGGGPYQTEWIYTGVVQSNFSLNITADFTFYLVEMARVGGVVEQWVSSGGAVPVPDAHTISTSQNIADQPVTIGWDTSGADASNGDIAELLLYSQSLTAGDQSKLENYLLNKYWNVPLLGGPASGVLYDGIGPSPQR